MKNPKISVIVPVAPDRRAEITDLRKSLERQTYKNYELIVESGKNVARNRNKGFQKSRGQILLFLDSDIILTERILELVINTLKEGELLLIWRATAFAALYRKDFIPFDENFRYAEDNKWFDDLENSKVKIVEIIQNRGIDNKPVITRLKKAFWYPFEWRKIKGIKMGRMLLSFIFDIISKIVSIIAIIISAFWRK
jgi:glycosyltransferase involved in cell wall biosynthesis